MKTKKLSVYQTKLKDPQWQKKRLEILSRDNFTCLLCKDTETTLHVHHHEYKYGREPWDYADDNFATLCEHCHKEVEVLKMDNSFDEIIIEKFRWSSGRVTIILYAASLSGIIEKIYDAKGQLILSFKYDHDDWETMRQFTKKCSRLDDALERKSIEKWLAEYDKKIKVNFN